MNNHTIAGVDLAKNVIQICIVKHNKVQSNFEMSSSEFSLWLATTKSIKIIFEACGSANYWKRVSIEHGHDGRIISARLVAQIRQNQKTDKNDALAIAQASQLTAVNFISGKSFKQQELQCILRMRELAVKTRKAQLIQIKALLREFNIKPSNKQLNDVINSVLEDAENEFSFAFRKSLKMAWDIYLVMVDAVNEQDKALIKAINNLPDCKKLMALEGVKKVNAVYLYLALGCPDETIFKKGSDAAACIGLTPIQYTTGGKVKMGTIGKHIKNSLVRKHLISGAMSVVKVVEKRQARTTKEAWLKGVIERRGAKCAAVALANKTVRTAYAMLMNGTNYSAEPFSG